MANILSSLLQEITKGDSVRDYAHASALFAANNYELAPKSSFLYFVHFDVNPKMGELAGASQITTDLLSNAKTQAEVGMMVKQVSLPKFKIDAKTLNAYNRPHVVQTKIHYDPLNITFHDDSADRVRNFWYDYYTYYYRNSDYAQSGNTSMMNNIHSEITNDRKQSDWGYTVRNSGIINSNSIPYLNNIRIYSLFNKKFSEYLLINPIITSFQHGEHNAASGGETLAHTMTVEYESVQYAYGTVSANTVTGFADVHYDKTPSPILPIGGGGLSITNTGGITNSVSDIVSDVESGNFGGALLTGARAGNTFKGITGKDLSTMAKSEALTTGRSILTGNNPFSGISIPGL